MCVHFDFPSKYVVVVVVVSNRTSWIVSFQSPPCRFILGAVHDCQYLNVVAAFAWPEDLMGFADGRVATVRISHTRRVKGDDPAEKAIPWSFRLVFGVRPTSPNVKSWARNTQNRAWHGADMINR